VISISEDCNVTHPIIEWPPRIGPLSQFYRVQGGRASCELWQSVVLDVGEKWRSAVRYSCGMFGGGKQQSNPERIGKPDCFRQHVPSAFIIGLDSLRLQAPLKVRRFVPRLSSTKSNGVVCTLRW
jgi:hypothetical protein